jgi:hypothetical protein
MIENPQLSLRLCLDFLQIAMKFCFNKNDPVKKLLDHSIFVRVV